jgi:hypothetical protein
MTAPNPMMLILVADRELLNLGDGAVCCSPSAEIHAGFVRLPRKIRTGLPASPSVAARASAIGRNRGGRT